MLISEQMFFKRLEQNFFSASFSLTKLGNVSFSFYGKPVRGAFNFFSSFTMVELLKISRLFHKTDLFAKKIKYFQATYSNDVILKFDK